MIQICFAPGKKLRKLLYDVNKLSLNIRKTKFMFFGIKKDIDGDLT